MCGFGQQLLTVDEPVGSDKAWLVLKAIRPTYQNAERARQWHRLPSRDHQTRLGICSLARMLACEMAGTRGKEPLPTPQK